MERTFNRTQHKRRRQRLRTNSTRAEKLLWSKLKGQQLGGLKFRRQCGIGDYVVDFFCPLRKLAIEVDGDVHGYGSVINRDIQKQEYLEKLGITVLRFTNGNITESMDGVLERIISTTP